MLKLDYESVKFEMTSFCTGFFCYNQTSMRKVFETRSIADDERSEGLESQLKEAKLAAEEADRKYDEVMNE